MTSREIFLVGALPPPVHGMATINVAIANALLREGRKVVVCNIGARTLQRNLTARAGRVGRVIPAMMHYARFCLRARDNTLYVGLSGGLGQLYETVFVLIARLTGASIILHHHSFAYIYHRSRVTRLLCLVAGQAAIHVALSKGMAARLNHQYQVQKIFIRSNAGMLPVPLDVRLPTRLCAIGYLSNISFEKGIREFVFLAQSDSKLKAVAAGPAIDPEVRQFMVEAVDEGLVMYRGPVDTAQKCAFFDEIDCFVFPTNYVNEAEPLVVLEAMSHGRPVIATARGCIKDLLAGGAGLAVPPAEDFVVAAQNQIRQWRDNPEAFVRAAKIARERFTELRAASFDFSEIVQ